MKKIYLLLVVVLCFVGSYAQTPKSRFVLATRMTEQFSQSEIDRMYQNDFAQLFRLNYKMLNYALITTKLDGMNCQKMNSVDMYAKSGVVVDEKDMIENGVNPFQFDFPQDEYRYNVFPMHTAGFYVVVLPKVLYDERMEALLSTFVY